jgi:putative transposase
LPKDISPVEFMANIKANSSKWFRSKFDDKFHWQDGYGMFSVSRSNIPEVEKYISNQQSRHAKVTSDEEFEALVRKHRA